MNSTAHTRTYDFSRIPRACESYPQGTGLNLQLPLQDKFFICSPECIVVQHMTTPSMTGELSDDSPSHHPASELLSRTTIHTPAVSLPPSSVSATSRLHGDTQFLIVSLLIIYLLSEPWYRISCAYILPYSSPARDGFDSKTSSSSRCEVPLLLERMTVVWIAPFPLGWSIRVSPSRWKRRAALKSDLASRARCIGTLHSYFHALLPEQVASSNWHHPSNRPLIALRHYH